MYRDLLEMERQLDWTISRKRVEVQDAVARIIPVCVSVENIVQIISLIPCAVDNTNTTHLPEPHSFRTAMATERREYRCRRKCGQGEHRNG